MVSFLLLCSQSFNPEFSSSKHIEMFHKGEWICMYETWNNNNHQTESHTDVFTILFFVTKYILHRL